jgi:hypothetical protein
MIWFAGWVLTSSHSAVEWLVRFSSERLDGLVVGLVVGGCRRGLSLEMDIGHDNDPTLSRTLRKLIIDDHFTSH